MERAGLAAAPRPARLAHETVLARPLQPVEHTALDAALTAAVRESRTPTLPRLVAHLLDPTAEDAIAEKKRAGLQKLYTHDLRVAPWAGTAYGVLQAANTYD